MMKKMIIAVMAGCVLLYSASGYGVSQEAASPSQDPGVSVSGKIFFQWRHTLQNLDSGLYEEQENVSTFELTRAYIVLGYKIDDIWSVKVILDAGNDGEADDTDTRYRVFIKNAYGQAAFGLLGTRVTFRFGVIPIPLLSLMYQVSDNRWLQSNYIDNAKALIYRTTGSAADIDQKLSLDYTADIGASLGINFRDVISVTGTATNGNGFKKTKETESDADGEDDANAYSGLLTITPVPYLYLAGFYRFQGTQDQTYGKDNYITYYGGMIAVTTAPVKIGVSYILGEYSYKKEAALPDDSALLHKYSILDAFVNINLLQWTGIPVLIAGSLGWGVTEFDSGFGIYDGFEAEVLIWNAGLGYQFNKKVRMMAYYENIRRMSDDIEALDPGRDERTFYIKTEVTF
jgi:hypothetical protein